MRNLKSYFKNRTIDYELLLKYGFRSDNNIYTYKKNILNDEFQVIVSISDKESISKVIDLNTEDEYILVDVNKELGSFASKIKCEYDNILDDIKDKCTNLEYFKFKQSRIVIDYIKDKYKDNLEYLWEKFPNNAIWRNKINNKWYGVIMEISASKLGLESDMTVEIIDLRYDKETIMEIIDGKKIFPGYHMNKKSWITIILDGSVNDNELIKLIDNSYELSLKK